MSYKHTLNMLWLLLKCLLMLLRVCNHVQQWEPKWTSHEEKSQIFCALQRSAEVVVLSFDLQYIKAILWVWKTIRWPFAGQQVSFKSTMNLCTDQVRNLVKGTITHSLKLVLNGVSPQIRPLTPDLCCCSPITPTAFSCLQPTASSLIWLRA